VSVNDDITCELNGVHRGGGSKEGEIALPEPLAFLAKKPSLSTTLKTPKSSNLPPCFIIPSKCLIIRSHATGQLRLRAGSDACAEKSDPLTENTDGEISFRHESLRTTNEVEKEHNYSHENFSQRPGHKLRLPQPKTPILLLILSARNNQIRPLQPTLSPQPFSESREHVLFVLSSPTLLEDLDKH
jgi:hypothetical protein